MDTRLRHGELTAREEPNHCYLLWDVVQLKNQIDLCVSIVATGIAVLVTPSESCGHLPAVVDPEDARSLVSECCKLEDVIAALRSFESFIVHRTRFTP